MQPNNKDHDMLCPMCDHLLTWHTTNPLYKNTDDTTHIYTCPECPFVGLEYYNNRNVDELRIYLNRDRTITT